MIVERLPRLPNPEATIALLRKWREEDATDDPDEIARRNKEWEEFRDAMNETARMCGRPPVYP